MRALKQVSNLTITNYNRESERNIRKRGGAMDKIKRNERLGAMTRILLSTPNRIHTLGEFCDMFGRVN